MTFCNGKQLDGEQVLLAVRSRFDNLQQQPKKGGGGKETQEEDLVANVISRKAPVVVGRGEGIIVSEGAGTTGTTMTWKSIRGSLARLEEETRQLQGRQCKVQALWRGGTQIRALPRSGLWHAR